ncbi:alanine racemase [Agreia sp. COWG]|uniref:alanine racemase n=1 Tax=Agreia sp. COWG TaxID=2773266 RepID=UPI0019279E9B|nr:alanine racemase C-terminal domain-containing protein [Agreia sp. COWG]CAD5998902.1 Ala_racemase_C domain-containing protein [Agreia sp. COWG]
MVIPVTEFEGPQPLRRALIDLDVLRRNAHVLVGEDSGSRRVVADLRADAYGHGAASVAAILGDAGVDALVVSRPDDAAQLADAGIDMPVITLRGPVGAHSELREAFLLGPELFGLDSETVPDPAGRGLVPSMTLEATILATKRVGGGEGVSYGYVYTTRSDTTLAMVSLGYSDGIDRHACDGGVVWLHSALHPIAGRVAMDVFMIDVGDAPVQIGETAVLFGDPAHGHPSPSEWARALHKTGAEVTSTLGDRIIRSYR